MKDILIDLAVHARAMQLFAHMCHNVVGRATFFSDHEHLGELYGVYETAYDDLVERCIGLHGVEYFNHAQILSQVCAKVQSLPQQLKENKDAFRIVEALEQELRKKLEMACKLPDASEGTKQLLGGMADESEKRSYLIKRRMA